MKTARADKSTQGTGRSWHLAVVDDDPVLRWQVAEQLQHSGEHWQVTSYHNGADALQGMAAAPPQVVLMEQTLLDGCGLQWASQLKRRHPQLPVVIHTVNGSPEKLFQALTIPTMGYMVKTSGPTGWAAHLQKAMAGGFTMCEQAERWLPQMLGGLRMAGEQWNLSRRERDVMICLCRQLSDKEIAAELGVSDETVHWHLRNAFNKLGVHDRKAAVQKFSQHGSGGGGG